MPFCDTTRYPRRICASCARWALACILLLSAAFPLTADAQYFGRNKVQYDDFDFRSFETEHYDIYYYPEEQVAAKDAGRMAERWYTRHAFTFEHEPGRKPVILYANDADFQQTNVIEGVISQGTGGVTEGLQERVVMPMTGIYRETDHVLGHELVHSYQYDIAQLPGGGGLQGMGRIPLWLVEGMAEYLSVGRDDPHTAMWIRDAIRRDDLPSIEDLSNPNDYFPYRYGQAYMAYIGGRWGDRAVTRLFRLAATTGLDSAITAVTGLSADSLSELWKRDVRELYIPLMEDRVPPSAAGRAVLSRDVDAGEMNLAPVVSPDGRYVAFLSERDLFDIQIFLADTETGEVFEDLSDANSEPHFDALRYINSAGTWSPDGEQFAYVVFEEGDNRIYVLDVESEEILRRIKPEGVGAIANPAWSPDGRYLAFSGIHGGISDLYLYDFETRNVRQITSDRYADLQPDWSPDGRTLVWSTDRGPNGTNFDNLEYAEPRLAFMNLETGNIRVAVPFPNFKHINPQYSPDGRDVYFISDRAGFSNIYRMDLSTGALFQVTNVMTGVSGITDLAPAMSVAEQSGLLMFSVFHDQKYTVFALPNEEAQGTPIARDRNAPALAGTLPPVRATRDLDLVGRYLLDPDTGLPDVRPVDPEPYTPGLRLTYVGPPTLGVGYSGQFGAGLSGGVSFYFSDILGNHLLGASIQAQGSLKDIGGEVLYVNRDDQFNYGVQLSHQPYVTGRTTADFNPETGLYTYQQSIQRLYFTGGSLQAQYPFSTTRRVEATAGYTHVGYGLDVERVRVNEAGEVVSRSEPDVASPDGYNLFEGTAALVSDYSSFGFVSPVQGGRYRLEAGYTAGSFQYGTLRADYRRYFFFKPVTLAFNAYHYGRYGVDAESEQLYPLTLGYSTYNMRGVHGYSTGSFSMSDCVGGVENCPAFERTVGSRIAVASAEVRIPLIGSQRFGLINFPYLPTELVFFGDAGVAWTADRAPELTFSTDRTQDDVPVFSTGAAARMNVLGYTVLELYYAYPFQRPDEGWVFGLTLTPGW